MRRVLYYDEKLTPKPSPPIFLYFFHCSFILSKVQHSLFLQTRKQILIVPGIQIQIQTENVIYQFIDEITIMNLGIKELNMNFIGEVSLIGRNKGIILMFHIERLNKKIMKFWSN